MRQVPRGSTTRWEHSDRRTPSVRVEAYGNSHRKIRRHIIMRALRAVFRSDQCLELVCVRNRLRFSAASR